MTYVLDWTNDLAVSRKITHFVAQGNDFNVVSDYMKSLINHISLVVESGRKLGVDESRLAGHDQTKFTDFEFMPYANRFYGENDESAFQRAWLHHKNCNDHHWNYWLFWPGYEPAGASIEDGKVFMPDDAALEMVGDWLGSSLAYTGSDNMTEWLTENIGRISLHSRTAAYVGEVLTGLGYGEIVANNNFL